MDEISKDEPMKSLDKAVWWIEYVIRHRGAKHLRYHGRTIPFYQYHFFDVIGFVLITMILCIIILIYGLRFIMRRLFQGRVKSALKRKSQ